MFSSKTLTEHVARGAVGVGAIASSIAISHAHPFLGISIILLALVALRGCPMCWTIGLAQTLVRTLHGQPPADAACTDGSCATRSADPSGFGQPFDDETSPCVPATDQKIARGAE